MHTLRILAALLVGGLVTSAVSGMVEAALRPHLLLADIDVSLSLVAGLVAPVLVVAFAAVVALLVHAPARASAGVTGIAGPIDIVIDGRKTAEAVTRHQIAAGLDGVA